MWVLKSPLGPASRVIPWGFSLPDSDGTGGTPNPDPESFVKLWYSD